MALPELLINSPTPGVREKLTTLKNELSEAGVEFEIEAAAFPTGLRKAGQFRILIGNEIILCEGNSEATKKVKVLERGAEGSTKMTHPAGASIYQIITAEGLTLYGAGLGFEKSVAIAYRETAQKITSGTFNRIKINKILKDPGNNVKTSEGVYAAPSEGYYAVFGQLALASITTVGAVVIASIGVNEVERARGVRIEHEVAAVGTEANCTVGAIVFCKAGDKIELMGFQNTGAEVSTATSIGEINYLSIMRVGEGPSGPENQLVADSIAIAYRSTAQKLATGVSTLIKVDTVIKDPGGHIESGVGYTVPSDGYYSIEGQIYMIVAANSIVLASIRVSGTPKMLGSRGGTPVEAAMGSLVAGVLFCKKGEKIELYGEQSGTETALVNAETINRLSVARIGSGPEGPKGATGPEGKAGEWSNLTLESTVWEAATGQTPAARTESGSAAARLRGRINVKAGKSYTEGALVFTVPAAVIPPADVTLSATAINPTNTLGEIRIKKTSGKAEFFPGVATGGTLLLDGLTYNLT